jgi:hypothetical protein
MESHKSVTDYLLPQEKTIRIVMVRFKKTSQKACQCFIDFRSINLETRLFMQTVLGANVADLKEVAAALLHGAHARTARKQPELSSI